MLISVYAEKYVRNCSSKNRVPSYEYKDFINLICYTFFILFEYCSQLHTILSFQIFNNLNKCMQNIKNDIRMWNWGNSISFPIQTFI